MCALSVLSRPLWSPLSPSPCRRARVASEGTTASLARLAAVRARVRVPPQTDESDADVHHSEKEHGEGEKACCALVLVSASVCVVPGLVELVATSSLSSFLASS